MPTPFTARVFKSLEATYRFVGGLTGLSNFSLGSAIQPVHDLAREAAMGSGLSQEMGYFVAGQTDSHAGAGQIRATVDPFDQADDRQIGRELVSIWLITGWAQCTVSANYVTASIMLRYPTIPDGFAAQSVLTHLLPDIMTEGIAGVFSCGDLARPAEQVLLPIRMPDGTTIRTTTQAVTGANEIGIFALCWAGAKDSLPPGVA